MKRAFGGGRKALSGLPQSRKSDFECPVSVCDYTGRSDNVINHLKTKSEFDSSGNPVHNIEQLSESIQMHSKYFINNKLTKSSNVKLRVKTTGSNPFAIAAAALTKKKTDKLFDVSDSKEQIDYTKTPDSKTIGESSVDNQTKINVEMLSDSGPNVQERDDGDEILLEKGATKPSFSNVSMDSIESIGEKMLLKLGLKPGESLIEAIADAVFEKLNPKVNENDQNYCNWIDDGENLICECCFNVLNSDRNIPSHLANMRRRNFGVFNKEAKKLHRNQTIHKFSTSFMVQRTV